MENKKQTKKRYTKEEDQIIIDCVQNSPNNLRKAFKNAADKLVNRDSKSVSNRWYKTLKKDTKNPVFVVISSKGINANKKNAKSNKNPSKIKKLFLEVWNNITYKLCQKLF